MADLHEIDKYCFYCGQKFQPHELRPYAPGGAYTCYPCMVETPEREAAAEAVFHSLVEANAAVSTTGIVAIGEPDGPRPFDPNEVL